MGAVVVEVAAEEEEVKKLETRSLV